MDTCRPTLQILGKESFDEKEITSIVKKTNALANKIRIKIIKLLLKNPELCVCEIEKALDLKQSKVSYHLALLVNGGFINRRQSGPWSYYTLNHNASAILQLFDIA
ncbi:MAG TPA: ArsR family transcriptional regulator [Euryarchaeota archaeon]|nr:arsenical resistance operon repressor [archaeon BMS3Abin16]GBE56067.1 arsenical resistance operon repressor [archaeon BMS3Bbin16]HDH28472.1 ArsR family transcriptional regulator [Euryarchaeota archaeon]HDY73628.1 ArsR family transcriptional regulator [Euryarchaeota archaeon]